MGVDRARLPALGVDPSLRFPEIRRRTLDNGLRVCTIEHHAVPDRKSTRLNSSHP